MILLIVMIHKAAMFLAISRLVDEGFNPSFGARPLRRAIIRLVEDSIAEKILSGEISVYSRARYKAIFPDSRTFNLYCFN